MSWLEKYKTEYVVTTGDGQQFYPKWFNARKAVEYNTAIYEYLEVPGSEIIRGQPKGTLYSFEIVFDGENHLTTADTFDKAAADPRPWTIAHPLYGSITVQPTALSYDNSVLSLTKIVGTVIETITEDGLRVSDNPANVIAAEVDNTNTVFAETYANTTIPTASDASSLSAQTTTIYNQGKKATTDAASKQNYLNLFNRVSSKITNLVNEPLEAMRTVQALINYPSQFTNNIKNRLDTFIKQYELLQNSLTGIFDRNGKKQYESTGGAIITGMAETTVTNIAASDYQNRNEVLAVAQQLFSTYELYVTDLDSLQSEDGNELESYIPDATALRTLSQLVSYTLSNLFIIAEGAKQQRTIILSEDTDVVQLAHKLYGLDQDDSTIDYLIETNSIGKNQLMLLKKQTKIVYYV